MINRRNGAVARAATRHDATTEKNVADFVGMKSDDVSKYTLDLIEFAGAGIVTHLAMDLGLAIITGRPVLHNVVTVDDSRSARRRRL